MGALEGLQPHDVFRYFEIICSIPHGSGKTNGIAAYLLQFAHEHDLESYHDDFNNVIIRKRGSPGYEQADMVILQGHHDMVCAKDEGVVFDFEKDAIQPYVDGDWIRAKGTTLGGDDGIAVAMMLAILADDTIAHPPLEMVFTADEEIGMPGAFGLDCSQLHGKKLVNLDSEFESVLLCSCAGGLNVRSSVPVKRSITEGTEVRLSMKNFKSGHSGVEINKGRANANMLMGRLLHELAKEEPFRIVDLFGGARETAIAAAANAVLITESPGGLCDIANRLFAQYAKEYAAAEPEMTLEVECGTDGRQNALSKESSALVTHVLLSLPNGVIAMSADMPGLIQTSANCGIMRMTGSHFTFTNTIRSSMTGQKYWIRDQIETIVGLAGGTCTADGDYPGWAYNPNSAVKNMLLDAFRQEAGEEATVDAVHAGIECGIFADKVSLDCVAIGPQMEDVHTPEERLSISSSERLYRVLLCFLEKCK